MKLIDVSLDRNDLKHTWVKVSGSRVSICLPLHSQKSCICPSVRVIDRMKLIAVSLERNDLRCKVSGSTWSQS